MERESSLLYITPLIFNGVIVVDYAKCSEKLVSILGLKNEPVAVKLYKKGEPLPTEYPLPEKNIRHCQSIMRARKGECLLVPANKHACPVGGSALGLMPTPEKVVQGTFHYTLGMYDSEEAARHTIEVRPALEPESIGATLVCPLSKTKYEPDVIVVVGTPEQIYWLMPAAATYMEGGRVNISTASFQASCADSTILPFTTGAPNISMGCYGCRKATDIAPEEMLMGLPASSLERTVGILEKLNEKAIPSCRGQSKA